MQIYLQTNMNPLQRGNMHNIEQNILNMNRSIFSIESITLRIELASIQDRLQLVEDYLRENPPPIEEFSPSKRRRIH